MQSGRQSKGQGKTCGALAALMCRSGLRFAVGVTASLLACGASGCGDPKATSGVAQVTSKPDAQAPDVASTAGDIAAETTPPAPQCPLRQLQVPGADAHLTELYPMATFGESVGLAVLAQLPQDAFLGFYRPYIVQYYRISTADWQWHTQAVAYSGETEPSMLPTGIRIGPNGSMLGTVVGGAKGPKVCHWSGVGLPSCATYSAELAGSSGAMVLAGVDWTQGTASGWRREKSSSQVVTATLWPISVKFSAAMAVSVAPAAGPSVTVVDDNHLSSIVPLSKGVLTISTVPQSEARLMRRYSDQGKLLWEAPVQSGPKKAWKPLIDETSSRILWLVTDSLDAKQAIVRSYDFATGAELTSVAWAIAAPAPEWLVAGIEDLPGADVAMASTSFGSPSSQPQSQLAWFSKENRLIGQRNFASSPGGAAARYIPHAAQPLLWWLGSSAFDVSLGLADLWGNATCETSGPCWQKTYADCADPNPCTSDLCDAAHGGCFHEPLPDGVECAQGKVCKAGTCL